MLNNVQCRGSEANILDCPKGLLTTCESNQLAGVNCYLKTGELITLCITFVSGCYIDCEEGDIQLTGGRNLLEGRVETCSDGVWGTVCSTLWSVADAAVVCRQLGYAASGTYRTLKFLTW